TRMPSSSLANSNSHLRAAAHLVTSTATTNRLDAVADSTRNLRPILKIARFIPTPNSPTECLIEGAEAGRPKRNAYFRATLTLMPLQLSAMRNSVDDKSIRAHSSL